MASGFLTSPGHDSVVGTIKAERYIDSEGEICVEFGLFSVDPSQQSHGIGRRLLSSAEGTNRLLK